MENNVKTNTAEQRFEDLKLFLHVMCVEPFRELWIGLRKGTLPWAECCLTSALACIAIMLHLDRRAFAYLEISYPENPYLYWSMTHLIIFSPFWFWGLTQTAARRMLKRNLAKLFLQADLKNALGRLPGYVYDRPIDEYTRRLKLSNAGLPKESFVKTRRHLEAGLRVFIDDITENMREGTIDIVYSHTPMPDEVWLENPALLPKWTFMVGRTRARVITASLLKVPHLLIAGQTGGGKSTFLSQFITTMYVNDKDCRFTLIDLKGGMELGVFAELERVKVFDTIKSAVGELKRFETRMEHRMKLFKENKCKELESYLAIPKAERKVHADALDQDCSGRHIIVIDEAAEMFLAGYHAQAKDIMEARHTLSQIARKGRSVGIHLVVSTQRPDTKSLDPQVKTNLTGILCFQMPNDASSINVLGNGRATDLVARAGRGIWKCGSELVEVQTPRLADSEMVRLLGLGAKE